MLKPLVAPVIGIGDDLAQAVAAQQQVHLGTGCLRPRGAQAYQVVMVHGQNQVKALKILRFTLTGTLGGEVIAAPRGSLAGASIRRLASMPLLGTRRVDDDARLQSRCTHAMTKHALGGWRAADITHADKQDLHYRAPRMRRTRSRSSAVSTPAGGASSASSTWMRTPCQRARNCSRHSVSSSQHGPQATKSCRKPAR